MREKVTCQEEEAKENKFTLEKLKKKVCFQRIQREKNKTFCFSRPV